MDYSIFQMIILLDDTLDFGKKKELIKEIKTFICKIVKRPIIKSEGSRKLAYEINNHESAFFVAAQLKVKTVGANKRIRQIEEKLNTYEEIIKYKIVQKDKIIQDEFDESNIYIVYEFDYGDISIGSEPRVTLFGCYNTIDKAREKANELLQEGLEQYFAEKKLLLEGNPFEKYNEIHLYNEKDEDKQNASVYYIKIEKLKLK